MLEQQGNATVGWITQLRENLMAWLNALLTDIQGIDELIASIQPQAAVVVLQLVAVFGILVAVHLVTGRLARRWARAGGRRVASLPARLQPFRTLLAMALLLILNAAALAVALGAGYLVVVGLFLDDPVGARLAEAILLAFAATGAGRLLLDVFLTDTMADARLLPVDEPTASVWRTRLVRLVGFGAYGLFLIAGGVGIWMEGVARLLALIVVLGLLAGILRALRDAREPVAAWLRRLAAGRRQGVVGPVLSAVAPIWHWIAGGYALAVVLVGLSGSTPALVFVGTATLWSVVTLLLAGYAGFWSRILLRERPPIPAGFVERHPMLGQRLRLWLPRVLLVVHALIAAVAFGLLLHIWNLVDMGRWLAGPTGTAVVGAVAGVLVILLIALVAWLAAVSWIEYRLSPDTGEGEPGAREKTLLALFRNALAIAIVTIAGMVALAEIGINIGPLIAGAGVIGLAIGFGAQKLVQDIITGVFIQLEDAIHTDDFITAGGISGTVERLSIRSLGLRDLSGTLHVVPFSSVDTVSNFTRDFGVHLGQYGVAYRENIGDVIEHLHKAYARLCEDEVIGPEVTGPLEVDGVTSLGDSSVNIRVRVRTTAGMQWAVGRAMNRTVKEVFDEAGIEIPFPHTTLYFGEDKKGSAPPARLAIRNESSEEG